MISGNPFIAGAIIARKIDSIIQTFYDHSAFDERTAKTMDQLDIHSHILFKRLASKGVIRKTPDGRYYLDKAETNRYLYLRRKRVLITLSVVFIIAVLVIIFTNT